ncbi:glycosyltransferase [Desulfosporosinus sp. SB140]|uniref:glycosyltransferase n=1 Tax=Desulfosporosinus paludis TaxID=3115649 RepID=UPI00388E23D0
MITKNEEDSISACLESVKNLVQEIIVVDTGSTDQTPELVLAEGGKLLKFAWEDDFARARNFSLLQASCPWILVLDADEVLEPVSQQYFSDLLNDEAAEGYFLNIINIREDGAELSRDQVVRLFRNKPEYIFEGAIHEQIVPSILRYRGRECLLSSELTLKHRGYSESIVSRKEKIPRNMRILRKHLDNNQKDNFLWYCLGLEYYQEGNIEEGLNCLRTALSLMLGWEGYFNDTLLAIGSGYLKLAEWEKLRDFVDQSMGMMPFNPDLLILSGLANFGLNNYEQASKDLLSGLETGEVNIIPTSRLYALLGDLANLRDDFAYDKNLTALDFYLCGLKLAPDDLYPLCQIIGLWQKSSGIFKLPEVSQFISWERMLSLYGQVKDKEGEYRALAPILLLFCAYQKIVDPMSDESLKELAFLFTELQENLESLVSLKGMDEMLKSLLILTVKELNVTGVLFRRTFRLNLTSSLEKSRILIRKLLFLYIKVVLNSYTPSEH